MSGPSSASDVCVDCQDAKQDAQSKAEATNEAQDGLRLGNCQELYKNWADCIEREHGQAKACKLVMDEFKACHARSATEALARALPTTKR